MDDVKWLHVVAYVRFSSSISVVLFSSRSIYLSICCNCLHSTIFSFMQVYATSQASSTHYMEICQLRKKEKKDKPTMLNYKVTKVSLTIFSHLNIVHLHYYFKKGFNRCQSIKHISLPKQNNFNNQKHF